MKLKYLSVFAKASDSQGCSFIGENGEEIKEHIGYAPFIQNLCGGDYVEFEVENSTGMIVGWVPITDKRLEEILEELEE